MKVMTFAGTHVLDTRKMAPENKALVKNAFATAPGIKEIVADEILIATCQPRDDDEYASLADQFGGKYLRSNYTGSEAPKMIAGMLNVLAKTAAQDARQAGRLAQSVAEFFGGGDQ